MSRNEGSIIRARAHGLPICNCANIPDPHTVRGLINNTERGIEGLYDRGRAIAGALAHPRATADAFRGLVSMAPQVLTGGAATIVSENIEDARRRIRTAERAVEYVRRLPDIPREVPLRVMGVILRDLRDANLNLVLRNGQADRNFQQMMIGMWDAVSCCASQRDDLGKLALIAFGGQAAVITLPGMMCFGAGCIYGIYLDIKDTLSLIWDTLSEDIINKIGQMAKTAVQLLLTESGGELAYKIGYSIACDKARELISILQHEWYLIPFRLGQIIGPFLVEAILSAIGIGELLGITTLTSRLSRLGRMTLGYVLRPFGEILDAALSPETRRLLKQALEEAAEILRGRGTARRTASGPPDLNVHRPGPDLQPHVRESNLVRPRRGIIQAIQHDPELQRFLGHLDLEQVFRGSGIEQFARSHTRSFLEGAERAAISNVKGFLQEQLIKTLPWYSRHIKAATMKLRRLPSQAGLEWDAVQFVARITEGNRLLTDGMFVALSRDKRQIIILDILESKSAQNWHDLYRRKDQFKRDLDRLLDPTRNIEITIGFPPNTETLRFNRAQRKLLSDFGVEQPLTASIPREFPSNSYRTLRNRMDELRRRTDLPVRVAQPTVYEGALPNELAERLARIILREVSRPSR